MKTQKTHLGIGLLIGSAIGVATGYFLQSKKGKDLIKNGHKKAEKLQALLMKELESTGELTKAKYEKVVDKVMKVYAVGKEMSAKEAPEIRDVLLKKWKNIEKHLQNLK